MPPIEHPNRMSRTSPPEDEINGSGSRIHQRSSARAAQATFRLTGSTAIGPPRDQKSCGLIELAGSATFDDVRRQAQITCRIWRWGPP